MALCSGAAEGADVLVVEGLAPEPGMVWATRVNALMLKALDAELVLGSAPRGREPAELADAVAIAARGYGVAEGRHVGCILNRVCPSRRPPAPRSRAAAGASAATAEQPPVRLRDGRLPRGAQAVKLRPVAIVPCSKDLAAPRVRDVAAAVGATVVSAGAQATAGCATSRSAP